MDEVDEAEEKADEAEEKVDEAEEKPDEVEETGGEYGIYQRTEVAVKQLGGTKLSQKDIQDFMNEAMTMKNLPPHPNGKEFYGFKHLT